MKQEHQGQIIGQNSEKIELEMENQIAEEYDISEKVQNNPQSKKSFNTTLPPPPSKKLPYITFPQLKKIEEDYYSSIKNRQCFEEGDNSRSAGKYSWTPQLSCFTANNKTDAREDGIIQINSKQKLLNTPVLPEQNQVNLQIEFKIRRGEEVQIKSVGVDRKISKKLIFTIFHTGDSFRLRAIVPMTSSLLKVWKQIEVPLKLNENENIELILKESIDGKQFIKLNEIQFSLNFRIPTIPLYYFLLTGGIFEKITLEQIPLKQVQTRGKCETNCQIF